ncbi:MAG TPA: hypothetical protein PKJ15_01560 [Methanomassiliicoccales archaeon]|nr:hypothetical protein [Methanomassiliicoccales archaeon]
MGLSARADRDGQGRGAATVVQMDLGHEEMDPGAFMSVPMEREYLPHSPG